MNLTPIAPGLPALRAALAAAHLPVDDLAEPGRLFFQFDEGSDMVGFGGYERHVGAALLRSIVVLPASRKRGQGSQAVELLLAHAAAADVRDAYLLTTDAGPFFAQLGFAAMERSIAPAAILATRQAASLCPASATLMHRAISRD